MSQPSHPPAPDQPRPVPAPEPGPPPVDATPPVPVAPPPAVTPPVAPQPQPLAVPAPEPAPPPGDLPVPVPPPLGSGSVRYWPGPQDPPPGRALVAIALAGLAGGVMFGLDWPGLGWPVMGLVMAAVVGVVRGRVGWHPDRLGWALATVALLGVGMVRNEPLLLVACLLTALGTGSLALAGGRTVLSLFLGVSLVLIAPWRALPWCGRGLNRLRTGSGSGQSRIVWSLLISVVLLVVFGALLAGADVAFADLLSRLVPPIGFGRVLAAVTMVVLGAGCAYLAARRPDLDRFPPARSRSVQRLEWALPVAALDLLFLAFVLVQLTVLFGGRDYVLRTADVTEAQYARSGFWQLLAVTVLTLAVLGAALRLAPRASRADRVTLRLLLGALAVLTLVIVASALSRMAVYEQVYGYTRLRVYVSIAELWLGLLFVLVLVALASLRTGWLPQAVVASVVLALLGTGLLNPDGFIAERNVARYHSTGKIDVLYLRTLSADAVPALAALPEQLRDCPLRTIGGRLGRQPDDWQNWNWGRYRARQVLARTELTVTSDCWRYDSY